MGEIASAYVRIRPNMAGFRSETQAGVRGAFAGIGKVVGVAIGGIAAAELVKSAVGAAADIQKQIEVVRYEFGRAGDGLIKFADTTGVALGDANRYTDAASARFGLLFKSLGVGQVKAAQMTVGFEKLALSVNAIRGGGASGAATLLQQIVLAAAGNTRGLKQMGIVVDSVSEKIAAFKLGLISSMTQSLTPAMKTQAIFAIATAHLGETMALARKHSGDLANVQARLSAEWMTAKEALGKALLPAIEHGAKALADWLQRMNRSGALTRDFATAAHVGTVAVKSLFTVVKAGVNVWHGFSNAVGGGRHALMLLAGAFAVNKIRKFGAAIRTDVNGALTQTRAKIAANVAAQKTADAEMQTSVVKNVQAYTKMEGAASTYGTTVKTTAAESAMALKTAAVEGEVATTGLWTSMKVGAVTTALTIKGALISTGIGALMVAIGIAAAYILTHWDQVKRWTVALGAVMAQVWRGLKEIIIGAVKLIGGAIGMYLTFPMKEFIDVAAKATGWIPYLGDGVNAAAKAVDNLYASMKNLASGGKDQIVRGAHDIGGVGKAWSDSMAKSASDPTQKKKLANAGKDAAGAFSDGFKNGVSDGVAGVGKTLNDTLHNVIVAAQAKIKSTVQSAKDNLVRIGSDLAKTIDTIQAKMGGAAGALAGSPQGKAFAKLKKLIESGAPSFEIARARAALSTQLAGVGKQTKTGPQKDLGNLTAAFNQGKISYKQFNDRLHAILRSDGITLAKALKTGGSAFATTYKAQVAALGAQAQAIAAIPAKYRGIGGAGGAADIKIIQPLDVIKNEELRVRVATQKAAAQAQAAAQKQAEQAAAFKQVQLAGDHAARQGVSHASKQRSSALNESKKHTALLGKIANAQLRAHTRRPAEHYNLTGRPAGSLGPSGPQGLGPNGRRRNPDLAAMPAGPGGPAGVQGITTASRAGAATIREAIQVHRGAVVRAVAGLGAHLSANERAMLTAELKIVEPLDRLRSDQARIGAHAAQQRERLIRSSDRTNTLLRRIVKTNVRPLPGYGKQPKGKGSHEARQAATVGSRA